MLPSLFRQNGLDKFYSDYLDRVNFEPKNPETHSNQLIHKFYIGELNLLHLFGLGADEAGHETAYSIEFKNEIKGLKSGQKVTTLELIDSIHNYPKVLELMGQAQHYGIPTRLLDWTTNPVFALFFAGYECICNGNYNGKIAIWCVDRSKLFMSWSQIKAVDTPYSSNDHLRSQNEIFLYDTQAYQNHFTIGEWVPFEKTIDNEEAMRAYFIKVQFPKVKLKELFQLLYQENITPSRVMPSLARIADDLILYSKITS